MKIHCSAIAVALATSTAPVFAADEPSVTDAERKICKRSKKVNSRFATQICRTKAEWDAIAEANKRDFAEQRDRPAIGARGQ